MTTPPLTSLTKATESARIRLREQIGPLLDEFDAGAESQTAGAHALGVGDAAPRFTLPDARGGVVALDALLPAVLVFYRGAWCPYCNLQLAASARRTTRCAPPGRRSRRSRRRRRTPR
jgi:hypothetical protein